MTLEPPLSPLHLLPVADKSSRLQTWQLLRTQGSCTWFLPQSSLPLAQGGLRGKGEGAEPLGMVKPGGQAWGRPQGSGGPGSPPACGIPALAESLISFWPGEIFAYF